jgi:hypothetical protein
MFMIKTKTMKKNILALSCIIIGILIFSGCDKKAVSDNEKQASAAFNTSSLTIGKANSIKQVRGQVLYLPIYSNIPYHKENRLYDLSAFITIHNTDFAHNIKITNVLYFSNDGKLVKDYLTKQVELGPLAATNFLVPETDKSGTGANFIVEWVADSLVNEPLIESVMVGLTSGQGVSFLSNGRVLRELKY